ncbi:MAG: ExeA family protein [Planctomycetaceae bacterium]
MTHEAYFGFLSRPFQAPPRDESFVPLEPAVDAIRQLSEAAAKGDGIGVLTAASGLGKTVVCRQVRSRLECDFAIVLLPSCNFPTRRSMLQAILHDLGCEYAGLTEQETRLKVLEAAQSVLPERAGLVLIVDEAHQLGTRNLEELRCLTNHIERGQPLIRVLLSGQLALEELLTRPELQSLNYRITCHATLEPLTMRQSARYLDERLARVGGDACTLFSDDALEMICRISDGNPRCLNQFADACLSCAAQNGTDAVDVSIVRCVLPDLKQLPLQWNESACDQVSEGAPTAARSPLGELDEEDTAFPEFEFQSVGRSMSGAAARRSVDEARSSDGNWSNHVATFEVGGDVESTKDTSRPVHDVMSTIPSRPGRGRTAASHQSHGGERVHVGSRAVTIGSEEEDSLVTTATPAPIVPETAAKERGPMPSPVAPLLSPSRVHPLDVHELQELPVDDPYAALDRVTGVTLRMELTMGLAEDAAVDVRRTGADAGDGNRRRAEEPSRTSESSVNPRSDAARGRVRDDRIPELADSPEENIDRVIRAVSDAVAQEIARDRVHPQAAIDPLSQALNRPAEPRRSSWRATPDPSAFDVVEPAPADTPPNEFPRVTPAMAGLSVFDAGSSLPIEAAISEAFQVSSPDQSPRSPSRVSDDEGQRGKPERPYARLFSRARRLQSQR